MTIPAERTISVLKALDFLHTLARRTDVPDDVRNTALQLARHFPSGADIRHVARAMAQNPNPLAIEKFCVDDAHLGDALTEAFATAQKYDFT